MPELRILNGGRMRIGFNLRSLGDLNGLGHGTPDGRTGLRYLTDAEGEIGDHFRPRPLIELGQQRRLQKNQLLQPHGISDNEVEFFEPKMCRPRVRSDRLPDHLAPLLLKAQFE